MNQEQIDSVSRRDAIQRGLGAFAGVVAGAVAGAALVGVADTGARAAEAKLAKSAVQYVDAGKDEGKDCDDCVQFVPGKTAKALGTCKIVEGAINPHGHCIAFSPKPKK